MFAVRGWAVPSAALKTQTDVHRESLKEAPADETMGKPEGSRKRKRQGSDSSAREPLLSEDLSHLWQEHIERASKPKGASISSDKTKNKSSLPKAPTSVSPSASKNDEGSASRELNGATPETPRAGKDKKKASLKAATKAHAAPNPHKGEKGQPEEPHSTTTAPRTEAKAAQPSPSSRSTAPEPKLTTLQTTMQQKLISSRFRHLNESLYTKPSEESLELFRTNPQFFQEYHDGFRRQVDAWPENPRDTFLAWIRRRGALDIETPPRGGGGGGGPRVRWKFRKQVQQAERRQHQHQHQEDADHGPAVFIPPASSEHDVLPRDPHNGICTIADLGCGEGQLGQALVSSTAAGSGSARARKKNKATTVPLTKQLKLYIYSYDLATRSETPHVTACDIRELPLASDSVDVAIFCLALMGTNWLEFVDEAYRVLRWRGECWISEVGSRFDAGAAGRRALKGAVVEHSVGYRRNGTLPKKDKKNKKKGKGTGGREEEDELDQTLLDQEDVPLQQQQQSKTDVSAFVAVLRRRGLQLVGSPEMTGGDKATGMFVRMRFIKCLHPTKGKNVPTSSRSGSGANGKLAFIDDRAREEISDEVEAAVLKPCVYKIR